MLVVGAPRGNSTYPEHRGVYEPGVVYQCGLDRGNNCQHIVLASKGNIEPVDYNSPVRPMRENSWLGGAIAVQDNGERFVACAPRWRNSYYRWSDYSYFMNGACYLTDTSESRKETILPLNDINKQTLRNYYLYLYGEAGFTAHFPKNSTEILLGAPGIYNWQGAVIRIRDRTFYDIRRGMQTERITDIPTPLNSLLLSTNGYFGYSVSSGRFLSARSSHLYVAGSPRNAQFRGKVCIFDFPLRSTYDLQYIRDLDGTQMGEYFGGALCVVDLNGDRLDDLVVASPQFSLQATNSAKLVGDEGRIYVFINGDNGRFKEITGDRMIMGNRRYGARFGTAVANVGDLNMDGYEDIAVGAPYEGNGVVYIYHGCLEGVKHKPAQIIEAENIDKQIKGFGISLSKGVDIDGNYYKDIAVGAFKSGHAVVLASHPVVTFLPVLTTNTRSVSLKMFNFSCTACLTYAGNHVPDSVDAKVTMQVDLSFGRANFISKEFNKANTYTYNVTLHRGTNWCKDLMVQNKQRASGRTQPLILAMIYELANDPIKDTTVPDEVCMECPVVDVTQPNVITAMVAFETGCKSVVCEPDLKIEAEFVGLSGTFILGEQPTLKMKVEVKNMGEPAILTSVSLEIPRITPIVEIPSICHDLANQESKEIYTLVCEIGYPLEKNFTINLLMNTKDISAGTKDLTFKVNATSVGKDVNPYDNYKELVLQLAIQADMEIVGISSQDQIVYMNKDAKYIKDLMFNHTFQVRNLGPSTVETADIEFQIPHQYVFPPVQEIFMRVLEHQLQTSADVNCSPVKGFRYWNASHEIPIIDPELPDGELEEGIFELNKRRPPSVSKRSIYRSQLLEDFEEPMSTSSVPESALSTSNFSMPPSNRTLFLNCTDPKVDCFVVKCSGGPFLPNKTQTVINFQLRADLEVLHSQLNMKDIILFSSFGKVSIRDPKGVVQPEGHKPDFVNVHTRFIGKIPEVSAASWIIVLAIICGILILLLIAMALYKIGFFERGKKEELQALKNAEVPGGVDEGSNFQAEVISGDNL